MRLSPVGGGAMEGDKQPDRGRMEDRSLSPPGREASPTTTLPSHHALKGSPGGWRTIKYIIGNETFEKLASLSLISNITVYLTTNFNMAGILLLNVVNVWSGSLNVTSVLGALAADTYLGRFWTLLFGSILSFLGMMLMTLTAAIPQLRPPKCLMPPDCVQPQSWQLSFVLVALALIALGAGGIRPCNIAFGADQFDTKTEKGRVQLQSFFNWWYFSFTIALVIALTVVVYIQSNVSWVLGFAIPTVCLFLSIVVFLIGYETYVIVRPEGSFFIDMFRVIVAAFRKRRLKAGYSIYDMPVTDDSETKMKLPNTDRFLCLDKAAMITGETELNDRGTPTNKWSLCSLQQVEGMKMVLGVFPVWLSGVGFLMVWEQQNTIGILQAIQTNKNIGRFKVPPAWMGLSSMMVLSIWILVYERVWLPQAKNITGKKKRIKMEMRLNVGIIFSILCPLVAAAMEMRRRREALSRGSFESSMSILLLLPQFSLSGLIEAFGAVALMEFLSLELPKSMRTVSGAIFFLSLSLAGYINSVLINIIHKSTTREGSVPWLGGQDINKNRLEYFYFLSAGLAVLNLVYFNLFARRFVSSRGAVVSTTIKDSNPIEESEDL